MAEYKMGITDIPIEKVDDDLFGIASYVRGLTSFINVCKTPMTISIQGDWGTGKTSMMKMLETQLKNTVYPIWFNTWRFSQFQMGNSLAFSMIDVLIKELGGDKNTVKKLAMGLVGLLYRATIVATDSAVGGEAADLIKTATQRGDSVDIAEEIANLKEKFQAMVKKKLKEVQKDKVVVFIDDLDRLDPTKAVELLEVLKLFLDCEDCVFILAVDYDVISLGIRQKYGDNNAIEKGKNFFDKIIQLPFKMPVSHYTIRKYILNLLQDIQVELSNADIDLYMALIKTSIGLNPRSIKRLFNIYQLLEFVSENTIPIQDVNKRRRLLFAVVCLQMAFENFYAYLLKDDFNADTLVAIVEGKEEAQSVITKILPITSDEKTSTKKFLQLQSFLRYFLQAVKQNDDSSYLCSQEDIEKLKAVLQSSSVTAVRNNDEVNDDDLIAENVMLCMENLKKVIQELHGIGNFSMMSYPYQIDDEWRIVAFARNKPIFVDKFDMDFTCDKGNVITFNVSIVGKLGPNPLAIQNVVRKQQGNTNTYTYNYHKLFSFDKTDSTIVQQTVKLIRNIWKTLDKN